MTGKPGNGLQNAFCSYSGKVTQGESAPAGWYQEPGNSTQNRYWDGSRWTQWVTAPTQSGAAPSPPLPDKFQQTGQAISRLGANITWLVFGSAFLLLLLILFV